MKHRVTGIRPGSIAMELGIQTNWYLLSINGEQIYDVIDYEQLSTQDELLLCFEMPNGEIVEAEVEKDAYELLGLEFESGLMSPIRSCKNHCIFCFIDQMPRGGRDTLHFKDDDWRLSLIMGNYVTLTNVGEAEFERIIARRVSPLYISVHASDGDVRKQMMQNPTAGLIMQRLTRLKEENLTFHAQIVICPGINDGDVLERTLNDLFSLAPAAQSVALVPVGLTRFRDKLFPLRTLTSEEARNSIKLADRLNEASRQAFNRGFAYASDEMYALAQMELPPYEYYDDFVQIENGVGLLRQFEHGFNEALCEQAPRSALVIDGATGKAAFSFLKGIYENLQQYGITVRLHEVQNNYFGNTVTVSGLVTAGDIIAQLSGHIDGDALIIPDDMLRENDDVFLDGMSLNELSSILKVPIIPMNSSDGEAFVKQLFSI